MGSALRDAIELNLPDIQDIRPTRYFLQDIEKIALLSAQTWFNATDTKAVIAPVVQVKIVISDGFRSHRSFGRSIHSSSILPRIRLPDTPSKESWPLCSLKPEKCPLYIIEAPQPPEEGKEEERRLI
jgi:hypothetical protein